MLDVFRILLCGVGVLYLALRIAAFVRTVVRGYRLMIPGSTPNEGFGRPIHDRSRGPRPAIIAK